MGSINVIFIECITLMLYTKLASDIYPALTGAYTQQFQCQPEDLRHYPCLHYLLCMEVASNPLMELVASMAR